MRHVVLITMLALGACSSAPRNTPAQAVGTSEGTTAAPPPGASPADVYRLYDARRSLLGAELQEADDALAPLRTAGREDEYRRAWTEVLETVDTDALNVFLSDAQVSELAALADGERRMVFVMNLEPSLRPSQVEIRGEREIGDRATIDVRGYFDTPATGEPGWRSGTVRLVREASGWKVDEEDWGAPGTAEDDAPRGRLEFDGAVAVVDEKPDVSSSTLATWGGGWGFSIRASDAGYALVFSNIPMNLQPGDYPLSARPAVPGDADPATLAFPFSATVGTIRDSGLFDSRWDEDVTGTVTVESVDAGRMAGRFELTARGLSGPPVTVRGSFENIVIPEPVGGQDG